MHRFFISPEWIAAPEVTLSGAVAHQIYHVLRLGVGARVIVLDNSGYEWEIALTHVTARAGRGQIVEKRRNTNEPAVNITLYQALIRAKNFDLVLQKGTEIGVSAFAPIICERNVVDARRFGAEKLTRWRRIIREAAEQTRRGKLPVLHAPRPFGAAIEAVEANDTALIACPDSSASDLHRALASLPRRAAVHLFVGPEGGFTSGEIAIAQQRGIVPITLGPRIWRSETAGIVFPALVVHEVRG